LFGEQGFQEATITSTNIFMAKASMVGVSFEEITQNSNFRKKYVPNSSKNWTISLENTNIKVIIL